MDLARTWDPDRGRPRGLEELFDFNYLRQQGTENDVVVLGTGIFVSVINIVPSLLHVFSQE